MLPVAAAKPKKPDEVEVSAPLLTDSRDAKTVVTPPSDGTVPSVRMKRYFVAKVPTKDEIKAKLQCHILGQDDAMEEMAMLGYQILLEKAHVEADATWKFRGPHKLVF